MSPDFYNNMLKIDDTRDFGRLEIDFGDGQLYASIGYEFPKDGEKIGASLATTYSYEVQNKLIVFQEKGEIEPSNEDVWNAPENRVILERAKQAIDYIGEVGSQGFYVKKLNVRYKFVNLEVHLLQSKKYPNVYFPAYTAYKLQ